MLPALELVLTVCLAWHPARCHSESVLLDSERIKPMHCLMQALPLIEAREKELMRRGWHIAKFSCRYRTSERDV